VERDDGDRLQSPKHCVFFIEDRRWIMSKKFVTSHDVSETGVLSPSSDDVDGRRVFFLSRIEDG
jgi:hypothetical protein